MFQTKTLPDHIIEQLAVIVRARMNGTLVEIALFHYGLDQTIPARPSFYSWNGRWLNFQAHADVEYTC